MLSVVAAGGMLTVVARRLSRRWTILVTSLVVGGACAACAILLPVDRPNDLGLSWNMVAGCPPVAPSVVAYTDTGRPVELAVYGEVDFPAARSQADEDLLSRNLRFTLIRTASPDPASNCHGWVFTGGRYWVNGNSVDQILVDNGYSEVTDPHAGDLIIYRGTAGEVAHTAVVRATGDLVLVEGKWSCLGCYMHMPEQYPYRYGWTFYRSTRQGHVLRFTAE